MASDDWRRSLVLKHGLLKTLVGILAAACSCAQEAQQYGGVGSGKWAVKDQPATVETYRGKACLAVSRQASPVLKELEFESGTIEMDMALSLQGEAFLGVDFRIESGGKRFERIYFRPHASATPHAIQYDPHFNGYSNWQTYHGPLYEGNVALPPDGDWFHVKIEVVGSQARVFVDDAPKPQLVVRDLMSGSSAGAVGLWGTPTGAYFADIAIRPSDDSPATQPAPTQGAPGQAFTLAPGAITQWRVSKPFLISGDSTQRADDIRRRMEEADYADWGEVQPEDEWGLVNLNRLVTDRPAGNATVLAGVVLHANEGQRRQLLFDSAEGVVVFLNGQSRYAGDDLGNGPAWRVNPDEHRVELALEKGRNELVLAVSSRSFGWAFLARLSDPSGLVIKPLTGVE